MEGIFFFLSQINSTKSLFGLNETLWIYEWRVKRERKRMNEQKKKKKHIIFGTINYIKVYSSECFIWMEWNTRGEWYNFHWLHMFKKHLHIVAHVFSTHYTRKELCFRIQKKRKKRKIQWYFHVHRHNQTLNSRQSFFYF